jgi:hypothetical protein
LWLCGTLANRDHAEASGEELEEKEEEQDVDKHVKEPRMTTNKVFLP